MTHRRPADTHGADELASSSVGNASLLVGDEPRCRVRCGLIDTQSLETWPERQTPNMPFIHFDCIASEEGPLGLSLRPLLPGELCNVSSRSTVARCTLDTVFVLRSRENVWLAFCK